MEYPHLHTGFYEVWCVFLALSFTIRGIHIQVGKMGPKGSFKFVSRKWRSKMGVCQSLSLLVPYGGINIREAAMTLGYQDFDSWPHDDQPWDSDDVQRQGLDVKFSAWHALLGSGRICDFFSHVSVEMAGRFLCSLLRQWWPRLASQMAGCCLMENSRLCWPHHLVWGVMPKLHGFVSGVLTIAGRYILLICLFLFK